MAYKRSRRDYEADLQRHESPFVLYGTPLPPLDEHARDDGSYVPVWKQEVTDERGRKRLHGAFTGGFSAGYFNTVGSKEGWTPSTFVSSRKNRATNAQPSKQQKPEDFMDDEDLKEQEESRQLSTTSEFAGFGTAADSSQQDALFDLLQPAENSMGIKLLNKMGWKQGQGIGPRQRRQIDTGKDVKETRLIAPSDPPMISFNRKTDFKGLGFESNTIVAESSTKYVEDVIKEDNSSKSKGLVSGPKKLKTGFGVGILNDSGSDDEDPYSMGPKVSYNKTLGGDKKSKKQKDATARKANPLLKATPVFISKKNTQSLNMLRKCHDGRMPLPGFVLGDELDSFSTMKLDDEKYKTEDVPEGWVPSRVMTNDQTASSYTSLSDAAKASQHTAKSRAQILGEEALPGKSVFDFLSPAARDRLATASGRSDLPPARNEAATASSTTKSSINPAEHLSHLVPDLDPATAQLALQRGSTGFMPYSDDLEKRARYKSFLEIMSRRPLSTESSPFSELPPRAPNHLDSDWTNELNEFARAAMVFKPISGMMASRFTSASTDISSSSPGNTDAKDLLTRPLVKPPDPAVEAAKMGMFGPATRSTSNFYPARLLCKRFNVSMPEHGDVYDSISSSSAQHSSLQAVVIDQPQKTEQPQSAVPVTTPAPASASAPSEVSRSAVVDPDMNQALEQDRPGVAVFRAIFGDDSGSESD